MYSDSEIIQTNSGLLHIKKKIKLAILGGHGFGNV